MNIRYIGVVASVLAVAACGGGGGSKTAGPVVYPPLPPQTATLARQAPIVDLGGTLHVGADVGPSRASLTAGIAHRGVSTSAGVVMDGIGRAELLAYLRADAAESSNPGYADGYLSAFGATPPVVRVAVGATPAMISDTVRAVQLINAALPSNWQLGFSAVSVPAGLDISELSDGEIHVEFAPHADWPDRIKTPDSCEVAAGCATRRWSEAIRISDFEYASAKAWVDHTQLTQRDYRLGAIVHELIHTLGREHADPARFPATVMHSAGGSYDAVPGHVLHPLDREALLAVYGWLDEGFELPGELATTFGPWADRSLHIRGDIDAVDGAAFGVADRNGLVQPWAYGPTPHTNLADNTALSGTASWSGLLMGYGFGTVVGGDADMSIGLSTLRGELDFTNLEYWSAFADVSPGTGTTWGDGELDYTVRVRGNTFVQTGGDAGIVTGAFFGAGHEGMGGTLNRDDLAAAFGGSR